MKDETSEGVRDAIRRVAAELRRIEGCIAELCETLPELASPRIVEPAAYVRTVKVHKLWRNGEYVPMLRLTGRWLRGIGFQEATLLKVGARNGELTIQTHPCRDSAGPKQLTLG